MWGLNWKSVQWVFVVVAVLGGLYDFAWFLRLPERFDLLCQSCASFCVAMTLVVMRKDTQRDTFGALFAMTAALFMHGYAAGWRHGQPGDVGRYWYVPLIACVGALASIVVLGLCAMTYAQIEAIKAVNKDPTLSPRQRAVRILLIAGNDPYEFLEREQNQVDVERHSN